MTTRRGATATQRRRQQQRQRQRSGDGNSSGSGNMFERRDFASKADDFWRGG